MANTIANRVYRDKYRSVKLQTLLRGATVADAIFEKDTSNNFRIQSPYSSTPSVTVQALAGSYSPADFTTTDDTLTVTDEFIVSEHIRDFESLLSNFDLFDARTEQMSFAIVKKVDEYLLNNLLEDGTGTYTTPVGGFTNKANVIDIIANLISKVSGYAESYKGLFLVVENTDMTGIMAAQASVGNAYADSALNNGFLTNIMGVDIYVVRSGTFTDATMGTKTWTNAGHRVFGVKNVATYAMPEGLKTEEKMVSGKTGMEVVLYGYIGYKLWTPVTDLIVDITLA